MGSSPAFSAQDENPTRSVKRIATSTAPLRRRCASERASHACSAPRPSSRMALGRSSLVDRELTRYPAAQLAGGRERVAVAAAVAGQQAADELRGRDEVRVRVRSHRGAQRLGGLAVGRAAARSRRTSGRGDILSHRARSRKGRRAGSQRSRGLALGLRLARWDTAVSGRDALAGGRVGLARRRPALPGRERASVPRGRAGVARGRAAVPGGAVPLDPDPEPPGPADGVSAARPASRASGPGGGWGGARGRRRAATAAATAAGPDPPPPSRTRRARPHLAGPPAAPPAPPRRAGSRPSARSAREARAP